MTSSLFQYLPRLLAQSRGPALIPIEASNIAPRTDLLFAAMLLICGGVTLAIAILIIFFSVRYRAGSAARRDRSPSTGYRLEIIWTLAPLGLFLLIFMWAAGIFFQLHRRPAAAPLEINVMAKQWMWKFQHPGGQREIDELHLPVGRVVRLTMTSQDVIHSFFVPAFRVKQDVLPDRFTTMTFAPTRPGMYYLFCAEYCGTDHSRMRGVVYVQQPREYELWLAARGAELDVALAGAAAFRRLGCSACHFADSGLQAPSLVGLWGRAVKLHDGAVVQADAQYLRDSILLPNKHRVAGYDPIMPSFQGVVTDDELFALVEYIKSLAAPAPAQGLQP
ncbi:MAG TPA: cytochrome c oxidase subunit II [Candidatus Sumerlaeota bacterium]|nr:cytochrome c oxidase subunit II [Candidatus Sumerlaeota bacterium]